MATTLDTPLTAYPTLTEAARLLGVSASTLSRRDDLAFEPMGERDKRVPTSEVLRLGAVYRKRSINEIGLELIEYAREHAAGWASAVEEEVEAFFERLGPPELARRDFLAEAKRALPADLYRAVEHAYLAGEGRRPTSIVAVEQP